MWGATNLIFGRPIFFHVSIHAPVWGATSCLRCSDFRKTFQSTHPCGVRRKRQSASGGRGRFNPRTRVGCDIFFILFAFVKHVSIHAPVWGATFWLASPSAMVCFNPRTRVGCDKKHCQRPNAISCFNPRTRVGCDV